MPYDPTCHHRRSLRLAHYDYAQANAYFVTICTAARHCWLATVAEATLGMTPAGLLVEKVWTGLPVRFPSVELDAFVVMPNHLHGILVLTAPPAGAGPTLGAVLRAFKAAAAWQIRQTGIPAFAWQRNYYEHVIRNDVDLEHIRQYIADNPSRWAADPEYLP